MNGVSEGRRSITKNERLAERKGKRENRIKIRKKEKVPETSANRKGAHGTKGMAMEGYAAGRREDPPFYGDQKKTFLRCKGMPFGKRMAEKKVVALPCRLGETKK